MTERAPFTDVERWSKTPWSIHINGSPSMEDLDRAKFIADASHLMCTLCGSILAGAPNPIQDKLHVKLHYRWHMQTSFMEQCALQVFHDMNAEDLDAARADTVELRAELERLTELG